MVNEFDLIDRYFKPQTITRSDVVLGIGDDGAILQAPKDQLLVFSIDTLVAGTHFLANANAYDIGYKALAVNLSDLAAMGAEPAWFTMALTMPEVNITWIEDFTKGLFDLANQFDMQLIGGDTTRGPLAITIQAHGFVPPQQVLRRDGAQIGDKIYVSGPLGDAGLALSGVTDPQVLQRLHSPTPQIKLGLLLRGIASSAIDISDGLVADLGHILKASKVAAEINTDMLPLSNAVKQSNDAKKLALTAGDDYELCFTVPPHKQDQLQMAGINCTCIGEIKKGSGIALLHYAGSLKEPGFQHF